MVLNAHSSYPQALTYVVKLRQDVAIEEGRVTGRLEHLASGHQFDFDSVEELVACLLEDATKAHQAFKERTP
jgi:hypothetical protein